MTDLILFGAGDVSRTLVRYLNFRKVHIIAFADNDRKFNGRKHKVYYNSRDYLEVDIIGPDEIQNLQYDYILIATSYHKEIVEQLKRMGLPERKIIQCYDLAECYQDDRLRQFIDYNYFEHSRDYILGKGEIHIDLGEEHTLQKYMKNFPLYDRIFPYLAQLSFPGQKNGWMIDVGANVGDTMAAMLGEEKNRILCVEPTDEFYGLLCKNIENLPERYRERVRTAKYYVTDELSERCYSVSTTGTAHKMKIEGTEQKAEADSITMAKLMEEEKIAPGDIILIKTDTDGFDAGCLMSCGNMLLEYPIFLYWENQIADIEQYNEYQKLYDYLARMGYTSFYIFDNFGNFILNGDIKSLRQICEYLLRMAEKRSVYTFQYIDVLACKKIVDDQCRSLLEKYLNVETLY